MAVVSSSGPASLAAAEAHAEAVVRRSGTSFALGMRVLPEQGRRAMYAIYAFCREIDDIADEPGAEVDKRRALELWADEIEALYAGRPARPTALALLPAVERYALPKAEFHELIAGMVMDVDMDFRATPPLDHAGLRLYCRRVAGAVGLLSIHVFGEPGARDFALAMGDALQLTNILRDIGEDAAIGRLYLPSDLMAKHGIETGDPQEAIRHPALRLVCEELLREAEQRFVDTETELRRHDRAKLKPALVMGAVYRGYLKRLKRRGFEDPAQPLKLSGLVKAGLALGALLR